MLSASQCADQGFVRMPKAWLRIPMSPGAARLLNILCGYADDTGKTWYKLKHLSEIMGRSKGAISGYIAELRTLGLVETEQKKFGNGHNASLDFFIVGWKDFLAAWERMALEKAARKAGASPSPMQSPARSYTKRRASPTTVTPAAGNPDQDNEACAGVPPASSDDITAAHEASSSDQQIECPVQQTEHKDPTGLITNNQSTKTLCGKPQVEWGDQDERDWKAFRPDDNASQFTRNAVPEKDLLTKALLRAAPFTDDGCLPDGKTAAARASTALAEFAKKRSLEYQEAELEAAGKALAEIAPSAPQISAAILHLEAMWQPHWRRLSKPKQLCEAVSVAVKEAAPVQATSDTDRRTLSRAWVARYWLKKLYGEAPPKAA